MKYKRDTTYNLKVIPQIKEKIYSWLPPTPQAMAIWPIFAGDSFYARDYWVNHNYFENLDVQIVLEGELKIHWNDTAALIGPGTMALIPFGAHKLETGPAGFCDKKCIGFSGMALKILIKSLKLDSFFIIRDFLTPEIIELHDRIKHLLGQRKVESVPELSILGFTFLMKIADKRQSSELPQEIITCRHFMEQNIFQKLSMEDLSREAVCSNATLIRLFRKHLNTTPMQYLISLRVNYAKNLLENDATPIKEVASLCGYQNQLYFSNDFRKHTGASPREYRQNRPRE